MKLNILFTVCIAVRLLFAYFISGLKGKMLQFSSIFGFAVAVELMIIVDRKEGGFGQKVWWGNYRIIHSGLYLTFALLALNMSKFSYVPLLIDALLGILFFIHNRMT